MSVTVALRSAQASCSLPACHPFLNRSARTSLQETAYGIQCLPYFLRSPSGIILQPDVIMFNWGLHDGPLGNTTVPGQQGNASVYAPELALIMDMLTVR